MSSSRRASKNLERLASVAEEKSSDDYTAVPTVRLPCGHTFDRADLVRLATRGMDGGGQQDTVADTGPGTGSRESTYCASFLRTFRTTTTLVTPATVALAIMGSVTIFLLIA